jgi:cardiolipin synthase
MEREKLNQAEAKGKKGLATFLFSRIFIFGVMILLQIILFMMLAYNASDLKILSNLIVVFQFIIVIYILNDTSDPTMKLVWIIFMMFTPLFGILMYIYVRIQPGSIKLRKRLENIDLKSERYLKPDHNIYNDLQLQDKQVSMLAKYVYDYTDCPIYKNTDVTYFTCGEEKYKALIEQLEEATDFIFMEYFIIEEGRVWNSILRILEKKVQQGVEVRVMYDGLCSLTKLPIGYYKKLRKKGIKSKTFAPARPFFATRQNNRDHRKILVIDGKVAFTGGINLADEYMNIVDVFGHWKDTAVMLKGDVVKSFTLLFLQMWNISEKTIGNFDKYTSVEHPFHFENSGYVLGYGDDPYGLERIGESVYLHLANISNRYLHIITPYLVLDNVMMSALKFAAKRGVDVKIIMPGIPDKAYAFCLARTYYPELIQAGVEIYEYTPGFTHAKMFISDDDKATVGSTNLDYRSLYLHFENGCFIYKNKEILKMEEDFQNTIKVSKRITLMECRNRPLYYKACGKLLRLLAPLM